jgi:hypothetical protein
MSETEKPFTVSDRRHFAPDGRPRVETDGPGDAATPVTADRPSDEGRRDPARPSPGGPVPADFSRFLVGLGAQAGLLLSGEGLPEGTGRAEALEGAQSIIAILEMLKDKSEGRRTSSEDALLEDLLFQLRLAYVEAMRGGGA